MRNRLPTYPGRVHLAPVEGQANVFDLTRADQPQDPGTPLNKGTLLSDDVEALIWGAAADRTPNDAFGKVSELYQHWWSILHGQAYSYWEDVKTPITESENIIQMRTYVNYSKSVNISASGEVSLSNPQKLSMGSYNYNGVKSFCSSLAALAPVYIVASHSGDAEDEVLLYIPAGATSFAYQIQYGQSQTQGATIEGYWDSPGNTAIVELNAKAAVSLRACYVSSQLITVPAGETTYVHSPDRSAYPDSGTVDGLTYKYLGVPFENARTAAAVEVGSYTGTGTAGASNPNTLSFGFEPKLVIVADDGLARFFDDDGSNCYFCIFVRGMKKVKVKRSSTNSSAQDMKLEWSGKSLSWYYVDTTYTGYPAAQLNESGSVYVYVAIG